MSQRYKSCTAIMAFTVFVVSASTLPVLGQSLQTISPLSKQVLASSNKPSPSTGSKAYDEHWDILPLAGNSLTPVPPLLGETDTLPTFTRELIQVQWRPHDPIDLYIIRPTHVTKPPAVIFLYGYPTDTDRFRNDAYCASVVKHGFAAIGFVSALTGQRYHDRPMEEWFASQLPEALGASVHDVQMILNYIATREDLDNNRIGIYGQGSGGTIALLAASVEPRIKAVDVLDPWGDWPDWLAKSPQISEAERPGFTTPEFLQSVAPFDPTTLLPRMKSRTLRVQQTLFSAQTPPIARDRIMASVPASETTVRYASVSEYQEKASTDSKILNWMQSQLGTNLSAPNDSAFTK